MKLIWKIRAITQYLLQIKKLLFTPQKPSRNLATSYNHNVTAPNFTTINFIKNNNCKHIAEIGIYKGNTTLEIAKILPPDGSLSLFDFEDVIQQVSQRLKKHSFKNFKTFPNSRKIFDSYNWSLLQLLKKNNAPKFDYIFLDGDHTFATDGLTIFLADKLLMPNGFLDLDDYHWTLENSWTRSPQIDSETKQFFTDEQITTPHISLLVDTIIRGSNRYKEIIPNKIFQKCY